MNANANANQVLSEGLLGLLKPVVMECDHRIQAVFDSQAALASQIDTLAAELDTFVNLTSIPPLAPHLQKLQNSRNRLVAINTTLVNIMNRLDRINNTINPKEKSSSEKKVFGGFSIFKTTSKPSVPTQNSPTNVQANTSTTTTPTTPTTSEANTNTVTPTTPSEQTTPVNSEITTSTENSNSNSSDTPQPTEST
eukprot:TRINITY_DN3772_c0_g1_i1.p1 TRINITY_DN3772_c0_g1~~TRINITY_DN3772_c0_g1_i1.p1  ORF type:complete len:228 (-),score=67.97 TRINITY_DN3772_c0_g1_i1:98-682(-)